MSINCMTTISVWHGPLHLGGFNIFNLETEQGVMKTKMVISHIWWNDKVGKMLNISWEHLQLQAGVSWPVLVGMAPNSKNTSTCATLLICGISWMTSTLTYGLTLINGFTHKGNMAISLWRHYHKLLALLRLTLFTPNDAISTWEQQHWPTFVPVMDNLYAHGLSLDKTDCVQAISHFLYNKNQ